MSNQMIPYRIYRTKNGLNLILEKINIVNHFHPASHHLIFSVSLLIPFPFSLISIIIKVEKYKKESEIYFMTINEIHESLAKTGYCSNAEIDTALQTTMLLKKPMLIEGEPGTGKTALAKAIADGLGLPFLRVQMYEGLTDDRIMYDYNYQKQLLALEAIKPLILKEYENEDINTALREVAGKLDFYGTDFMIERPVLKSISGKDRYVLLFDEIDKAPEQIEYMLYEFLENYSITIPQYGEIKCPEEKKPLVFMTSNGYRELSDALKRRCSYLFMKHKSKEEMIEILLTKASVDLKLAEAIATCLLEAGNVVMRHTPSIAEGIDWAMFLSGQEKLTKDIVEHSLGMLVKDERDFGTMQTIVNEKGEVLWKN